MKTVPIWSRAAAAPLLVAVGVSSAQGDLAFTGTVVAAPNSSVQNTVVIACLLENDACSQTRTKVQQIAAAGQSAAFNLAPLEPQAYLLLAWRDLNGDGEANAGDELAVYGQGGKPTLLTPPATRLELRLKAFTGDFDALLAQADSDPAAPPAPASPPAAVPPPATVKPSIPAPPPAISPPAATSSDPGCKPPVLKALKPEAYVVKGYVVRACGQPLTSAKVIIRSAFAGATDAPLRASVKADGSYTQSLPAAAAVWDPFVEVVTRYDGDDYCLWLPPEGDSATFGGKDGAVRNFVWRLSGERPDSKPGFRLYYGGGLTLFMERIGAGIPPEAVVSFVFKPLLPLIDGSKGQEIVRKAKYRDLGKSAEMEGIPIGKYQVFAAVQLPGDAKYYRVYLRLEDGQNSPYSESVVGKFSENSRGGDVSCGSTPRMRLGLSLTPGN